MCIFLICEFQRVFHFQVKIFSGSFGGTTLWENTTYISPSRYRQSLTKKAAFRYENKIQQKAEYEASKPETAYPEIDNHDIFRGDDLIEKAKDQIEGTNTVFII